MRGHRAVAGTILRSEEPVGAEILTRLPPPERSKHCGTCFGNSAVTQDSQLMRTKVNLKLYPLIARERWGSLSLAELFGITDRSGGLVQHSRNSFAETVRTTGLNAALRSGN